MLTQEIRSTCATEPCRAYHNVIFLRATTPPVHTLVFNFLVLYTCMCLLAGFVAAPQCCTTRHKVKVNDRKRKGCTRGEAQEGVPRRHAAKKAARGNGKLALQAETG